MNSLMVGAGAVVLCVCPVGCREQTKAPVGRTEHSTDDADIHKNSAETVDAASESPEPDLQTAKTTDIKGEPEPEGSQAPDLSESQAESRTGLVGETGPDDERSPVELGTGLFAISGANEDDVWVVGTTTRHWDGNSWETHELPLTATLTKVAVAGDRRAWAATTVKTYADVSPPAVLVQWDGSQWQQAAVPAAGRPHDVVATTDGPIWLELWSIPSLVVPTQQESERCHSPGREYHTISMLMPDGRVWVGGSSANGGAGDENQNHRIELYEPWYIGDDDRSKIIQVTIDSPTGAMHLRTSNTRALVQSKDSSGS